MIKVSKWVYAVGIGVFMLAAAIARLISTFSPTGKPIYSMLLLFGAMLFTLSLYHRAWLAIQDGFARTTPGRAVGYSFIPLFNWYWIFVVMVGFVSDYNAFAERKKLDRELLSGGIFWALAGCWVLSSLPRLQGGGFFIFVAMVLSIIAVFKIHAAVDGLPIPEPLPEPDAEGEGGEEKAREITPPVE
jgi:hypothetical protein